MIGLYMEDDIDKILACRLKSNEMLRKDVQDNIKLFEVDLKTLQNSKKEFVEKIKRFGITDILRPDRRNVINISKSLADITIGAIRSNILMLTLYDFALSSEKENILIEKLIFSLKKGKADKSQIEELEKIIKEKSVIEKKVSNIMVNIENSKGPILSIGQQIGQQYAERDIINVARDLNINQNSPVEDLLTIMEAIRQNVSNLDIDEKIKKKIYKRIEDTKIEFEDKNPNKNSIIESIREIIEFLKEAKVTEENLKGINSFVAKIAKWLGMATLKLGLNL